uniref:Ig-like domain-containing protein n=1 Tax=Maylandia zebra TaxID=106582 RepID=A0A3P9BGB1_9CICH
MMTKHHESSQRPSLIFILWMLGNTDSCCDTVTKVQSYEGYSESVSCPYESQYHNSLKYICRGNRPSTCLQQALITSDTKQNGRFRLDDDKMLGTFTVTINSLTQNDSGSYLCGVQRNSDVDVFSAVELEVEVPETDLYCTHLQHLKQAVHQKPGMGFSKRRSKHCPVETQTQPCLLHWLRNLLLCPVPVLD